MSAYTPKYAPPAVMPRRLHATADMNIAPMIDVLLVLLVIFMAALPLSQQGLDATVPAETQPSASPVITSQIVVEYSAARRISLNREDLTLGQLRDRLRDVFAGRRDKTLYIMGDGALRPRRGDLGHRRRQRRRRGPRGYHHAGDARPPMRRCDLTAPSRGP